MRFLKNRQATLTIGAFAIAMLLAAHPALANSSGNPSDFSGVTNFINEAIGMISGPIAKLIALIAIITGAILWMQGREMGEGIKVFGVIAVVLGLIIGAVNLMNVVGGATLGVIVPLCF